MAGGKRWPCSAARLHAEHSAESPAQNRTRESDGRREKDHRPDAEGGRRLATVAEELEKLEDRFRDGISRLLLREDERVGNLEHRKSEGEHRPRQKMRPEKRQAHTPKRPKRARAEVSRGLLEHHADLLEPGRSRTYDEGQPAHGIGEDGGDRGIARWIQGRERPPLA